MTLPQRKVLPHVVPSWVFTGSIYFITICAERKGDDQLCKNGAADLILDSIDFNAKRGLWWPHLVLVMPDHLHGLFSFAADPGMKKALSDWKHYISRQGKFGWQRDFFEHRLRNDESFVEKAAYIRQNPVRAGLVDQADAWPYFRARPTQINIQG